MVKSLAFEHSVESQQTETLTGQVELVIRRLIDQSNLSAKKTSAQEFSTLVALFRKMSRTKMTAIWDKYFDCAKSKVCEGSNLNMKDLYRYVTTSAAGVFAQIFRKLPQRLCGKEILILIFF